MSRCRAARTARNASRRTDAAARTSRTSAQASEEPAASRRGLLLFESRASRGSTGRSTRSRLKRPSRRLRQELVQRFGQALNPASHGFADRVLHREVEPPQDLLVGLHSELAHLADRPDPDVVLLLAAALVRLEPDRVVADLVEEDREADRGLGDRGLDPVDDAAVVVVDAPRSRSSSDATCGRADSSGSSSARRCPRRVSRRATGGWAISTWSSVARALCGTRAVAPPPSAPVISAAHRACEHPEWGVRARAAIPIR